MTKKMAAKVNKNHQSLFKIIMLVFSNLKKLLNKRQLIHL